MTVGEIIGKARILLDDVVTPYLWNDIELVGYLNEALDEFSRRTMALIDSSTSSVCSIAVASSTVTYTLNSKIMDITSVRLVSAGTSLTQTSVEELDRLIPSWRIADGTPLAYMMDIDTGTLGLYPIPTAADTLLLSVRRRPLSLLTMSNSGTTIPIPERWHRDLLDYILYMAYSKQDADAVDTKRADKHYAKFLANIDQIKRELIRINAKDDYPVFHSGLL